jgi:hypothetical protein
MFMRYLAGATMLAGLSVAPALARPLDIAKPDEAFAVYRKIMCSTEDKAPVVYRWTGRAYSRVPGEPDRLLFGLEGMNIRACATVDDPVKGKGFRLVSREIMLYTDPRTGEVLRRWANPWTDETVDVIHVANDPVNQPPSFPVAREGGPFRFPGRIEGGYVFMPFEVPLFYENALGGKYQDYIGGKYHAIEIFDFIVDKDRALDPKAKTSGAAIAWVRSSEWLPWMKMRGRAGSMVFNTTGLMLERYDQLPEVMKREIAANYPEYTAPPPVDDTRPNETSWTYFGKKLPQDGAGK